MQLKTVSGQEMKILGEVTLQVVIGAWESKHKFVVSSSLTVGPVLGADFLSEHGVVVDLGGKKISWTGGEVELNVPGER